jgi:hypothetical protein
MAIGKKTWAVSGGFIPFNSTGDEPAFTSRDWISILNTTNKEAVINLSIYYDDGDPVHDYEYKIGSQRLKKIRFNDLINPLPLPLEKPFGCVIKSSCKVVVQFSRMDTSSGRHAAMGTIAYSE